MLPQVGHAQNLRRDLEVDSLSSWLVLFVSSAFMSPTQNCSDKAKPRANMQKLGPRTMDREVSEIWHAERAKTSTQSANILQVYSCTGVVYNIRGEEVYASLETASRFCSSLGVRSIQNWLNSCTFVWIYTVLSRLCCHSTISHSALAVSTQGLQQRLR